MWDESKAQKWLDVSGQGWANDEAALPQHCWEGPDPPVVPQNAGTVLHGCDTSLCKLFRTAETCLLWLPRTLCTDSSPHTNTNFTGWCHCFISGDLLPLVDNCSHPWKIFLLTTLGSLRWPEDHGAVLPLSNICKYFFRLFRWSEHLAPAQWSSETDLFTPMKRGQEHAANSWLTPLSNPASCQSLLILRALPALSLAPTVVVLFASSNAVPVTLVLWQHNRPEPYMCVRARVCLCAGGEERRQLYGQGWLLSPESWPLSSHPTFMCFYSGTVNRRGAASRPAVFSGWDPLKSGTAAF